MKCYEIFIYVLQIYKWFKKFNNKENIKQKKNRIVKKDGKLRFKGKTYYISKKLKGTTIEMRVTLRGVKHCMMEN